MSVRNDIKDNIVATMLSITPANGYSITMREATKKRYQWADWGGNEEWPKASIYSSIEISKARIGWNIYDYFWTVGVRIFYKGDDATEFIDDMMFDTKFSMLRDGSLTRGGFAWNTCYAGTSEDEDTFEEDRLHSSIVLNFTIHYREVYGGCN